MLQISKGLEVVLPKFFSIDVRDSKALKTFGPLHPSPSKRANSILKNYWYSLGLTDMNLS